MLGLGTRVFFRAVILKMNWTREKGGFKNSKPCRRVSRRGTTARGNGFRGSTIKGKRKGFRLWSPSRWRNGAGRASLGFTMTARKVGGGGLVGFGFGSEREI